MINWSLYKRCGWCGGEQHEPCRNDDETVATKPCPSRRKMVVKEPDEDTVACAFCGEQTRNVSTKVCSWAACVEQRRHANRLRALTKIKAGETCSVCRTRRTITGGRCGRQTCIEQ